MKILFISFLCLWAVASRAEKQPLERYQSIIDRQMFGEPPRGFDPTKMPSEVQKSRSEGAELTKEQEKLQSSLHFSVVNLAADGTPVVGFSDNTNPKAPVHHYIKVGEESGGWKVLAADPAEATMTVEKDGVELTLKLGDNSGKGGAKGGGAAVPAVAAVNAGRRSGLLGMGTLGSRRALREKLRQQEREDEQKRREEEALRREEERAQREQDRAEQQQQLRSLQEELSKWRAAKEQANAGNKEESNESNDSQ